MAEAVIGEDVVTLARDEGNRASTTLDGLAALSPVMEGGSVTAGHASQLADWTSVCVPMSDAEARRRRLKPLGMCGSRLVGTALIEARRRQEKYAVVTTCVADGIGAAGLFEIS